MVECSNEDSDVIGHVLWQNISIAETVFVYFFDIRPGTSVKRLALYFHYKMQKENEECKKNIKAKEVITTFCKLLSALDVESVPTAEVFRRAKFNRIDVVSDSFLSSPKPYFPQHT